MTDDSFLKLTVFELTGHSDDEVRTISRILIARLLEVGSLTAEDPRPKPYFYGYYDSSSGIHTRVAPESSRLASGTLRGGPDC